MRRAVKRQRRRGPKSKDKLRESFVDELRAFFGPRLKKVILFGSRARGDYSDESDYDFIIILDKVSRQALDFVEKLELKMLLSHYVLFTVCLFTEGDLDKKRYEPFIINALKEGVVL